MVYSPNKVVACLKVDGKILREDKNVVTLPFGSEYSVFIKNLNPRRIKVKITVDGTDATEGTWLVVEPNSDVDLERFIRAGNMDKGNRFKFIERTAGIEEHRGIKADDGLIRVEYQVENPKPIVIDVEEHHHYHEHYDSRPWRYSGSPMRSLGARSLRPSASAGKKKTAIGGKAVEGEDLGYYSYEFPVDGLEPTMDSAVTPCSFNEQGITVPGSESNQKFQWTADFATGPSEVIVLQLRGCIAGKEVVKAVTVETKLKCVTCGKVEKSTQKFCGQCGTALEII
jgi:hypothetical protein